MISVTASMEHTISTMSYGESILPLQSHPHISMECFSSSKVSPRLAAKLLADNDDKLNNRRMLIGLFTFDDKVNEWNYTGYVFEHKWTGDWHIWDRQCHFLFNNDASVLYVATRDNNTLYALDTTDHLKVIAKADLPFRPKAYTLTTTPLDSAVYITSTYPWIVSVYQARTLQLLGTAPSARTDSDMLDHKDVAKIYNPSTQIAHRRTYLTSNSRYAVVIDTPEKCCVSHELVCHLSSYVDLVYSGDCGNNPWLLDLETLRTVMIDLAEDGPFSLESVDAFKVVFRSQNKIFEVLQEQLMKCLDRDGHLSADAPTSISTE